MSVEVCVCVLCGGVCACLSLSLSLSLSFIGDFVPVEWMSLLDAVVFHSLLSIWAAFLGSVRLNVSDASSRGKEKLHVCP